MRKVWEWLKDAWIWIKSWFITYHRVTVSYNAIYGDADDQVFENVPKISFNGADGLNYKIEEM